MSFYSYPRSATDTPYLRPISLPDRSLPMSPLPPPLEHGWMLKEAETNESGLRLNAGRCWGLQMDMGEADLGERKGREPDCLRRDPQSLPSPASPTSATSRIPTTLNSDGARVLRRRRSLGATSPPPSPTNRLKQRFGVGDDEGDEAVFPLPSFSIPTPTSSYSPIFPLSPIVTTPHAASLPPFSLPPTLDRSSSLFRLLGTPSPLRRRSTTALLRQSDSHIPGLHLSRSLSDTKGKRAASGWKKNLGVLSEESTEGRWVGFEVAGSSQFKGTLPYGWSGGEVASRRLTITNPDEEDMNTVASDLAQVAMETDDASDEVGLAM